MSSAADPTAAFLAALQASRLLAPPQLQHLAAWAAQTRPDVKALAVSPVALLSASHVVTMVTPLAK